MRIASWLIVFGVVLSVSRISAEGVPRELVEGERVEAATELVFTEGPAYHADGSVLFTDIANNRIMRLNAGAKNGANRLYPNQNLDNPAGVYVFSKAGKLLGRIPVPEDMVTNCCFGDPDLKTLYVTGGKTLWKIRCKVPGRIIWPQP